jgi:endonuclease/exonuclease/phosphatase (EEP) superfamily protein YafD
VALLSVGPFVIALAALSGHGHRWVDILAQFVGPALVAVVLLLAAALVLRSRVAGTVAGLSLAFVIVAGTPQWFPAKGWAGEEPGFTLYFANLFVGNDDVEAIARSVREADADIVVLIEIGDRSRPGLDRVLAAYPHRVTTPRFAGGAGPSKGSSRMAFSAAARSTCRPPTSRSAPMCDRGSASMPLSSSWATGSRAPRSPTSAFHPWHKYH